MLFLIFQFCWLITLSYAGDVIIEALPSEPKIGEGAYLQCKPVSEYPEAEYIWYFNDKIISTESLLRFEPFKISDQGLYKCQISTPTFWASLTYYLADHTPSIGYSIKLENNGKEFEQDGPLDLLCGIEPKPKKATYSWTRNGVKLSDNPRLYIPNERIIGLVTFKCQVDIDLQNGFILSMAKTRSYSVSGVDHLYSIDILRKPTDVVFKSPFIMTCVVTGPDVSNIKYKWYKNNQLISHQATYKIDKFTMEDAAQYRCVARGSMSNGESYEKSLTLVVTKKIE